MEYEKIKKLMDDMGESNLSEISIDFPDGTKITIKKDLKQSNVELINEQAIKNEEEIETAVIKDLKESKKITGNAVKAPMVGTFYSKPSPDSKPYVEVGTQVKKGDTLCIIEAMKLMNEIESEFDGTVKAVLLEDGDAVEYGKTLFVIE